MSALARTRSRELAFVLPALDGPATGGTLFNRELVAALGAQVEVRVLQPEAAAEACGASPCVWVDSLFLARVPELSRRFARPIAVFLHYLPSFVRLGRAARRAELSAEERAALACADALWVPSAFMRDALEAIAAPTKKIHVLEPGTRARLAPFRERGDRALRVVSIGNVLPGKGYFELLSELARVLEASDRFELTVIGSLNADGVYANACLELVRGTSLLAARVRFTGELSPEATSTELASSDCFVSASRMESYGMALAEARATGVPILALDGGNARAHVHANCGGILAENQAELARALCRIARSPELARERIALARAHAPRPRAWAEVALEFLAQLANWEK